MDAPPNSKHSGTGRILRSVALLITILVSVLALVQVSGRLVFTYADALTPAINRVLVPYKSSVTGAAGDWRGFNPVLRAQRITFPAGNLTNVYVELDLFRSLTRGSPSFRHFHSEGGAIGLEYSPQGWRLKNSQDQALDLDIVELAQSVESVDAALTVTAERDGTAFDYRLQLSHNSVGLRQSARFILQSPDSDSSEFLVIYDRQLPTNVVADHTTHWQIAGTIQVPAKLLGGTDLTLSVDQAVWVGGEQVSSDTPDDSPMGLGIFNASLQSAGSPAVLAAKSPSMDLQGTLWRNGDLLLVNVQSSLHAQGAQSLQLSPIFFEVNLDGLFEPSVLDGLAGQPKSLLQAKTADVSLSALSEYVSAVSATDTALGTWARGLSVQADLPELVARYSSDSNFAFWAQARNVNLSAFRGSPSVTNSRAQIFGDLQHLGINVEGENVSMQFPDLFSDVWDLNAIQGELTLVFRPGYVSVRGANILALSGQSTITGGFATSRPEQRFEQRLTLALQIDDIDAQSTDKYIPYRLSTDLRQWLLDAPVSGQFQEVEVAHHGQIHTQPGDLSRRRFELKGDFQQAKIRYEKLWPSLDDADGTLHVAGRQTYVGLFAGTTAGLDISGADARIDANQGRLFLSLQKVSELASLFELVRSSPLQQSLSFITPQWRAKGEIEYAAQIDVPLGQAAALAEPLKVDIDASFDQLDLDMPDYRLAWRNLAGQQKFSLPHNLQGQVTGELFGNPISIDVTHDPTALVFGLAGNLTSRDLFHLADLPASNLLDGNADFVADIKIMMMASNDAELQVSTDLNGMVVNLPAHFGKPAEERSPSQFKILFADDHQRFAWQYENTKGWYVLPTASSLKVSQGVLGVSAEPLEIAPDHPGLVINGYLAKIELADWVSEEGNAAVSLPIAWQLRGFETRDFVIDDTNFLDLVINGQGDAESSVFQFRGPDVSGSVDLSDPNKLAIDLVRLRLPVTDSSNVGTESNLDPIDVEVGRALPAARVFINELIIGQEPFGRWIFEILPEDQGVRFDVEDVLVKGIHLTDSAVFWDLHDNRSAFSGVAKMDDLAKILPLWGYAPAVTSESASVSGNLSWSGSPADLDIVKSEGGLSLGANAGRFLDIESGPAGLRAVSLLNITALTKRMNLDFSDVVGDGISFEEVYGDIQLEDQKLNFTKNLIIKSTSSRFELGGEIDLRNNVLDAQMIVTLPVSDSLPWYAAYLALVNPLAGLGVAVGERVFREPIERMSSAKFAVSGSLDDPQVVFTELFNRDIEVIDEAGERLSPDLLKNVVDKKNTATDSQ